MSVFFDLTLVALVILLKSDIKRSVDSMLKDFKEKDFDYEKVMGNFRTTPFVLF